MLPDRINGRPAWIAFMLFKESKELLAFHAVIQMMTGTHSK
jgi:hypothetical protein